MSVSGYKKSKYQNQLASVNFRLKMVKEVFGVFVKEPNETAMMFEEVCEKHAQEGERLTVDYGQTRIFSLCRNSACTFNQLDLLRNCCKLGLTFNSDRIQLGTRNCSNTA